ncbi:MAG: TAXI family TRAP transporter solute-binding subunit [Pseudonocardia sp.]|nr:TAXI family TRAP transporter solute-binding subunit [Pseudonocardia sp.]
MTGGSTAMDRRAVLRAFGALGLLAAVPACASPFAGRSLTVATGRASGVYFALGTALAQAWAEQLDLGVAPAVLSTAGSVDNLARLASGAADVVFSQVDTAADHQSRVGPAEPAALRALARIYDDVVHVVVPASSPVTTLPELRGARVSLGEPDSGVIFVVTRLLRSAGLAPGTDLVAEHLGIDGSVAALREGRIDAFFWSGGLPTQGITDLAAALPIRLLNLEDMLEPVRLDHAEYAPGTVPAATYGIPEPITTLLVRNFLLVRAEMADDLARALVDTLFRAQAKLAQASRAALTIDLRAAIGTQPVPLHPGAERFYREAKDS